MTSRIDPLCANCAQVASLHYKDHRKGRCPEGDTHYVAAPRSYKDFEEPHIPAYRIVPDLKIDGPQKEDDTRSIDSFLDRLRGEASD